MDGDGHTERKSLKKRALDLFETEFRPWLEKSDGAPNGWKIIAQGDPDGAPLEELSRRGLVAWDSRRSGFRPSDLAVRVWQGEIDISHVLEPLSRTASQSSAQTVIIAENIAAVNTAMGGSAVGSVNVSNTDVALHKLVELQDDLGELSDELWRLLRRVRAIENAQTDPSTMKAAVEALEIESFVRRIGEDKRKQVRAVLELAGTALTSVLKGVS